MVLVEGGAGVGKSALLTAARVDAHTAGFLVLNARCSDLESTYAFGVVRQLFESHVRETPAWVEGSAAAAKVALDAGVEIAGSGDFDDVSLAVLHGVYWLTVNGCALRPLALVVDDAQWCDRPSLRFLAYLAGRLDGLRVLVLLGVRTRVRADQDAVLLGLAREPSAVLVEPRPLSEDGVAAMLAARLGARPSATFASACHRATGGNPLLLNELARAMRADGVRPDTAAVDVIADLGPRAVSRTVLLRLARLDDDAVALARAVAVLGEGGDLALLCALTGLPGPALEAAARALVRAEILRPEPPLGFVHPLVRDAVYDELSPIERETRHLRTAGLLREAGRPAEEVAAHALVLPPSGQAWAVDALEVSARIAIRRGAPENAVSYLRRALAEAPPPKRAADLVLQLGMAEALANDPQAAAEHLRSAYDSTTEPLIRARVAEVQARMLLFTHPPGDAVAVIRRACHDLPYSLVDTRDALTALDLLAVAFGADEDERALEATMSSAQSSGGRDQPGARMLAAALAWDRALTGDSADACAASALDALAGGVLLRSDPSFMNLLAAAVLVLADRDEALEVWAAAIAEGHARGSRMTVNGVHLWHGWNWLQRGALAEAEDSLWRYVRATELRDGVREVGMAYACGFLSRVMVERDDLDGARRIAARSGDPTPGSDADIQHRRGAVELLLAENRWQDALDVIAGLRPRRRPVVNPAWAPFGALAARALCALGRADEAVARAEADVAAARRWGSASALGPSLRALGIALDAQGADTSADVLEEAVAATDGTPARLEHAKSLLALGSALRRRKRRTEARAPLLAAADLAAACGASALADRAGEELLAAGGRRIARGLTGLEALTPSERRVAALAAAGRTNKAIAQELFVTPKTVEIHLSNTYRKLGVSSRTELTAVGL